MEWAPSNGLMVPSTRASSKTTTFTEKELTSGPMAGNTQATGLSTKCMGVGFSDGLMAGATRDSTLMIKNKAMVHLNGKFF